MDYAPPAQIVSDAIAAAEKKARLPIRDLLIRAAARGTHGQTNRDSGPFGDQLRAIAVALGSAGRGTAFVKGILCNWMVTLGAVFAVSSRSTLAKVVAMWLPIATFFAHGYGNIVAEPHSQALHCG